MATINGGRRVVSLGQLITSASVAMHFGGGHGPTHFDGSRVSTNGSAWRKGYRTIPAGAAWESIQFCRAPDCQQHGREFPLIHYATFSRTGPPRHRVSPF